MDSSDDELVDQLPLCSWNGVTCDDGKRNEEEVEFPADIAHFKKIHINVQGNKLRNLGEEMCNMKKRNGRLVGTFGCDAIFFPQNNFSSESRRGNVYEECQPCPDGNSSKHLGSDCYNPNASTENSEAASSPRVISETPG